MTGADLPDLLEALGELFLLPGAFDHTRLEALGRASWTGLGITPALQALLLQDAADLDVAYASIFLHGAARPTLHLEASVHRTGLLADPETLQGLQKIYDAAGIRPDPAFQPDHLGIQLALLAHLLRGAAGATRARARELECAARALIEDHLGPLAAQVAGGLDDPAVHSFYRCAGRLLLATLEVAGRRLATDLSIVRRPTPIHERRTHAP